MHHGPGKGLCVLLTGEVEAVHGLGVAPLVEGGSGLVVLQALEDGTVDDHLVVLELPADHAECIVLLVVVDLHLAEAGGAARGYPLLLHVIVDHHRGTGAYYALLTAIGEAERSGIDERVCMDCNIIIGGRWFVYISICVNGCCINY